MNYAPVILFAYNRPQHTLKVLQSLQRNKESAHTELFVFIDGLKESFSEADKNKNEEVISVVKKEKWCKHVTVTIAEKNKGLSRSVTEGVSQIINDYGRVIVLEDDLVCDEFFLKFMNAALELYNDSSNVACISAYIYPVKSPLPESFFIKGADCWGWATWKRAWQIYDPDGEALLKAIADKNLEAEFDFENSYPYVEMLQDQIAGRNDSWAVRWYASAFLANMLCLYPGHSLIKNIGNDGSGTHAGTSADFDNDLRNTEFELKKIEPTINAAAYNAIVKYFRKVFVWKQRGVLSFIAGAYRKLVPYRLRKWYYDKRTSPPEQERLWSGNYSSWRDLQAECTGYDAGLIFDTVKQAALQVKEGKAVFERDSVLFYQEDFNPHFVNVIDKIAGENEGALMVLDFGGSLGSVYFQYKQKLSAYKKLGWFVVEQSHFVEFGREKMEDSSLKFYYSVEECLQRHKVSTLLLSNVMSYIENPYAFLQKMMNYGFEYILVDRTLFVDSSKDVLSRQIVPDRIYKASYPCWIFSKRKLITFMSRSYDLSDEFDPFNRGPIKINNENAFFGALFFKKKAKSS